MPGFFVARLSSWWWNHVTSTTPLQSIAKESIEAMWLMLLISSHVCQVKTYIYIYWFGLITKYEASYNMPLCPGVLQGYDLQGIILWCCVFHGSLGMEKIIAELWVGGCRTWKEQLGPVPASMLWSVIYLDVALIAIGQVLMVPWHWPDSGNTDGLC